MSISISIADVIADAEFRLHTPAFSTATFVTTPAALRVVKGSVRRLSAMLVRSFGDGYFSRTATLTTQAGLDLVSLPQDFATLTSLHWVNGDRAQLLEHAHETEYTPKAETWTDGNTWLWDWNGRAAKYVLEANTIRLVPPPAAVYTLRCAYQTGLSIDTLSDTIQGQAGWDEWLVMDLCEVVRQREQKDSSEFSLRKQVIERDLRDQAANRDRNGVTQVRDVTSCDRDVLGRRSRSFWDY